MNLRRYNGRYVKITVATGQVFVGRAYDYVDAIDNTPEKNSITIGDTEIYEDEIASIEEVTA